jgi:predicted transposase YbfD/YdcC
LTTTNGEISIVRQMLDVLKLNGAVLTLYALHCQRETLEKINEIKAHVVVEPAHALKRCSVGVSDSF